MKGSHRLVFVTGGLNTLQSKSDPCQLSSIWYKYQPILLEVDICTILNGVYLINMVQIWITFALGWYLYHIKWRISHVQISLLHERIQIWYLYEVGIHVVGFNTLHINKSRLSQMTSRDICTMYVVLRDTRNQLMVYISCSGVVSVAFRHKRLQAKWCVSRNHWRQLHFWHSRIMALFLNL